ncbi:LEAF RUST 10 DISEASE-RESISTANCE LOCUS RECEPTOR-LIKE PROTEIN KINASE-like 1.2 isoform X1 [Lactuca sativa]|uniref:LEAF RUST 10 DISEASE-RESISTANCE LOCUS RECEPTOR-LIKE PROTEIN KINASE-like 1.2 isoform X1 n=1 Tax=Lactuca sativa TaxID=4236 RepID=UPI001C690FE7|nr:LEAF RUST 10 DISEASE-RESISTANCE LOCUS RECEPTOR-LIKE PROTEIN KINASE-like 1.2 isoform X1 [Lactuca sativa]
MSCLLHSLSLSLLLFPFFFFISIAAQSNDTRYPSCLSYNCANITISYPFWRLDSEIPTQFCGYEGFGINCSNNVPIVYFGSDSYYIPSISYESKSIVLVDYDVSPVVPAVACPRVRHSIDWGDLPFNFWGQNVNLSFHFNCTGVPYFAREIGCLSNLTNKSCVNSLNFEPENFNWTVYSCDDAVVTTVFDVFSSAMELETEFSRALRQGFEVKWGRTEDCEKCEESGGRCGHNNSTTELMCFCSGGAITMGHCKDLCQSLVHVPVHTDGMNELLYENYTDVLRKGFILEWQCSNCVRNGSGRNWVVKAIAGVVGSLFGIFVMGGIWYILRRRNNKKKRYYGSSYMSRNISSYPSSITDPEKNDTYHGVQIFKYRELEKATNYFDSKKELGDGGFGTVYHGKLKDGREVAVKRLYENNYKRVEQFMNEVGILAHLRHRNLVSLYGCTTHHSRELLLVYDYIPNGTVADHLHGEKSKPGSLPWITRIKIATETASALVYLHASDVVHRDVKTNNILLDNSFSVKVADFGLSRLFPTDVTHVSTAPQGTPGYVDPEYHECYQLTSKSDVYSFGVVLIELISSKPAVDITRHRHEINLSNMALNKIRNDALGELVDPSLGFETDYEVRKMINAVAELAFRCLQNERDCRPSMEEVLEGLNSIQNGGYVKEKEEDLVLDDDGLSLKEYSQTMSPDSVAIAWSTSTISTSGG